MKHIATPERASSRKKYVLSAFFAAALWGFMSIPLREIQAWPAEDILYYRIFSSVVMVWMFIALFSGQQVSADVRHWRQLLSSQRRKLGWLTFAASLLIMGNWFTFIYAVNHVSIQSAAFAYLVCPLLTTLAGYLILKEGLSRLKKISIGIALISVVLLARGSLYEVCWSVGIASLYALYLVIQRIIQQVDKLNVLAIQLSICSLLILPVLFWQKHSVPLDPEFWINIAVIAGLFTIIPLYLSMYALNGVSSATVGISIYINPIIAFAVAILHFHEQVNKQQLGAYAILMVAVLLFNWTTVRKVLHKFASTR